MALFERKTDERMDPADIMSNVRGMIEVSCGAEMTKLRQRNEMMYVKAMREKFSDFADAYIDLFHIVVARRDKFDMDMMEKAIILLTKRNSGQLSKLESNQALGKLDADKYVPRSIFEEDLRLQELAAKQAAEQD